MRSALIVIVMVVCGFFLLAGFAARDPAPSATRYERAGSDSVGWRDDFINSTYVSASSGVVLGGTDVRLPTTGGSLIRQGLMVGLGPGWDSAEVGGPSVILDQGTYKMWYFGDAGGGDGQIGYATSPDGFTWTKQGRVMGPSIPEDMSSIAYEEVLKIGNEYKMWYAGRASAGGPYRILFANSTDGVAWTKHGIVLNGGAAGSGEDSHLYSPTIVFENGLYRMWYSGQASGSARVATFFATSTDGLDWVRRGVVLSWGPPGSMDSLAVHDAVVRHVGSMYEMLYGGVAETDRLMHARSSDGVNWTKLGVVLDVLPPGEGLVGDPDLLVRSDGSWNVYYHARGGGLQIYLATQASLSGWVRTTTIELPSGARWSQVRWTAVVPNGSSLTVTVRDAASLAPIPGLVNHTTTPVGLADLSSSGTSKIRLEARFQGDGFSTPRLDAWEVTWTTSAPLAPQEVPVVGYWWVIAILVIVTVIAGVIALRRNRRVPQAPAPPTPGSLPPRP